MTCRHKMRLNREIFKRNLPILKRGDHIQMPLENPCLGTFLKHHAIVGDFKVENGHPELYVIEVSGIDGRKQLEIKSGKCQKELDKITLIEYRKRKYDHEETYERARDFNDNSNAQSVSNRSYNLFTRNCEHFAAACVNGPDELTIDNISKSTSLQSTKCLWVVFDVIVAILQCVFFILNFYIYVIHVNGKEKEDNFPEFLVDFFYALDCYHTKREELSIMTGCEWIALAFFQTLFLIVFLCILVPYQHFWLRKRYKCVCEECLNARKIVFWIKAILFAMIEIGNKFLERPLYDLIHCLKDNSVLTLFLCILISAVEAVFITWIASRLTKCLIFCAGNKHCSKLCCNLCKFKEDAFKYVVRNIHCHDISLCLSECFLFCGTCINRQTSPTSAVTQQFRANTSAQTATERDQPQQESQQPRTSTSIAVIEQQPAPSTSTDLVDV